mmetsp:Transcript_31589/g.73525  ORF Transcript_31589/g.73525 Transcript_31589/m.73525 type:complete len:205 (+) Transcript_31589:555-1169(+)
MRASCIASSLSSTAPDALRRVPEPRSSPQTVPATKLSPAPRVSRTSALGAASTSNLSLPFVPVHLAHSTPAAPRVTTTWRTPARTSAAADSYTREPALATASSSSKEVDSTSPSSSRSASAMATASSSFGETTSIASRLPRSAATAARAFGTETGSSQRGEVSPPPSPLCSSFLCASHRSVSAGKLASRTTMGAFRSSAAYAAR